MLDAPTSETVTTQLTEGTVPTQGTVGPRYPVRVQPFQVGSDFVHMHLSAIRGAPAYGAFDSAIRGAPAYGAFDSDTMTFDVPGPDLASTIREMVVMIEMKALPELTLFGEEQASEGEFETLLRRAAAVIRPSYLSEWLRSPSVALGGRRPVDLLAEGRTRPVAQLIGALETPPGI
jgi:hypothetical protein